MEPIEGTRVKSPSHTDEVLRVSRVDRVRNVDVKLRLGQEGILDVARRRQEK